MDIIESIKKDKAYVKCKLIVKTWEKEFKSKYSRTPSKFDIKEAPSKIKYAYKKYFQLKSTALENSLYVCDNDDELLGSPESIQNFANTALASLSPPSKHELPMLPSGNELEKLLSNKNDQKSVETAHPFTENLSKKLFQNSKFSLRNPRKLLLPKSQSVIEEKIINIDEENIAIANKTNVVIKEQQSMNTNNLFTVKEKDDNKTNISFHAYIGNFESNSIDSLKSPTVRQLDEAWLQRATGLSEQKKERNYSPKQVEKFGLRNIKVPNHNKDAYCDYVENSGSEGEDIEIDKLKPALKKRKTDSYCDINATPNKPKEFKDNKSSINQSTAKSNVAKSCYLQLNDIEKDKKKSKSLKNVDIKEQQPPDITEYLPFGLEEDIIPQHSQVSNICNTTESFIRNVNLNQCADLMKSMNKLEDKIKHGTLNDNFVKINIEKKVFVRGRKSINFSKYKKQQWKDKKALHASMEFPESGKISCFKCGEIGHMSRYCIAHRGDTLLPLENYNENDIPTLEDMQKLVSKETNNSVVLTQELNKSLYEPSPIPDSVIKMLLKTSSNSSNITIKPIYSEFEQVITKDLGEALKIFGHSTFRPGQEQAIKRILCGMSTLLILSTGGGKSLCYQLPAYLYSKYYKCLTLVISPLVSLMEDQVLNMPEFLKAGCLHTNQPPTQRNKIIQCIKEGELNILLISPEALISGDISNSFAGLFKYLPQIAFACIDEAHCVSHWSHNFRPSYLMICRVLREKLNVKCILGLTATASHTTIKSIISHINIPDGLSGVITNPSLPDNIFLSVSYENDKDRALVSFLTSERISKFNSIIVYCIRRDECERIAAILRSCLQETGKINMEVQKNKRKRMSYIAESYHAGMSGAQRKKIQKYFMDGTLRIIVATVAFGMGINKSDIRCIIHYNMPSSFESYVQEVGRAGRDGQPAVCHVLLNNSNTDKNELLKHIHANSIDRPTIRRLLQKVFIACECSSRDMSTSKSSNISHCKGHEVGIPIDKTVEELDLPSENIATLLCYVELHPVQYIKVHNNAYIMCKISSYGGPQKIHEATKTCRPLAMAFLIEGKKDGAFMKKSVVEFNVIEVAAAIGWESGVTKYQLKNLEWIAEAGTSKRSHLKVEFNTLGFRIKARGDLTSTELDSILDDLHESVLFQEKVRLYQLEESNKAFKSIGDCSIQSSHLPENIILEKSNELKNIIRNYFQRENSLPDNITLEERPLDTDRVISDVRALISTYKDCTFTGRSIARIFQGISSPNYTAIVWGRCKFWRSHLHEDFNGLVKIATQQIIQMKV